jgi:hypothetical protein
VASLFGVVVLVQALEESPPIGKESHGDKVDITYSAFGFVVE